MPSCPSSPITDLGGSHSVSSCCGGCKNYGCAQKKSGQPPAKQLVNCHLFHVMNQPFMTKA
eukprot:1786072-Amphidinium_carterae.2